MELGHGALIARTLCSLELDLCPRRKFMAGELLDQKKHGAEGWSLHMKKPLFSERICIFMYFQCSFRFFSKIDLTNIYNFSGKKTAFSIKPMFKMFKKKITQQPLCSAPRAKPRMLSSNLLFRHFPRFD